MFTKLLKKVKEESFETQIEHRNYIDNDNNNLKSQSIDVIFFE